MWNAKIFKPHAIAKNSTPPTNERNSTTAPLMPAFCPGTGSLSISIQTWAANNPAMSASNISVMFAIIPPLCAQQSQS